MEIKIHAFEAKELGEIFTENFFDKSYPSITIQASDSTTLGEVISITSAKLNLNINIKKEARFINLIFASAKYRDNNPVVYMDSPIKHCRKNSAKYFS